MCGYPWLGDNLARGSASRRATHRLPALGICGEGDRDGASDLDDLTGRPQSARGCVNRKRDDRVAAFVGGVEKTPCRVEPHEARASP